MAHTEMRMTAHGVGETCAGCLQPFARGAQMNAMRYDDESSAGWHCDECVRIWKTAGETALRRWSTEEPDNAHD